MTYHYILDGNGNPKPEPDLRKWQEWFRSTGNKDKCYIASDYIGDAWVSTIFFGRDPSLGTRAVLWLFETRVHWYGHRLDGEQGRYATREEALAGHDWMVARVIQAQTNEILARLEDECPKAQKLPGLDNAILGVAKGLFRRSPRTVVCYDHRECMRILMRKGMSQGEADEWLQRATLEVDAGSYTPVVLHRWRKAKGSE